MPLSKSCSRLLQRVGWTTRRLEKNLPGRIGVSGGETPMRVILRDSAYRGQPALVGVAHHHPLAAGLASVFGPWLDQSIDQFTYLLPTGLALAYRVFLTSHQLLSCDAKSTMNVS